MSTVKTILVPIDFSISSDFAIHYAVGLVKAFGCSLILYHTFIPFESGFYPRSKSDKENLEAENNLIKRITIVKDNILKANKWISISVHVDRGPKSLRLIEFCKKNKIDLIVMGTLGASGLKEIIIGSFTADMMTKAPCPILAIPKGCKFKIPKKITFVSNYHKKDFIAIKFLSKWNNSFNAKINILHIDKEEEDSASEKVFIKYKKRIEKQCESIPLSFQRTEADNVSKAISHIALNDKTDVLVISPIKNRSFWNNLLHKSLTKTTAYHIRIPLLSIPIK